VIRILAESIISVVKSWGGWSGKGNPRSSSTVFVRGFAAAAGRVPAEIACQPAGASALKIDSAIKDRPAFPTQTNRTSLFAINNSSSSNSSSSYCDRLHRSRTYPTGRSTAPGVLGRAWEPQPLQYVKRS
jgi:hypothetical protein